MEHEQILIELVEQLSTYNETDMLNGYLNPLAQQFNTALQELNMPIIKLVNEEG
jgi:hypothetical protein